MAWELFRVLLESQREDCRQRRELALAETIASDPDPVAMSRTATLLDTLAEIDAALDVDRIAAGTYGICVHCGAAIPEERLEFRPFASGCVSCQQSAGGCARRAAARRPAHRGDSPALRGRAPASGHGSARPRTDADDHGHLQPRHAGPRPRRRGPHGPSTVGLT